jgi:aspartate kinase
MKIFKFGGSSLGSPEGMQRVAEILKLELSRPADETPVVVCSALGKSTDLLEKAFFGDKRAAEEVLTLHREVSSALGINFDNQGVADSLMRDLEHVWERGSFSDDEYALVVSYGERLAVRLVRTFWESLGYAGADFAAWEVGFTAEGGAREALLLPESEEKIRTFFEKFHSESPQSVAFVTGFLAKDYAGRVLTLGRGGSDLTAVYLGASLGAEIVELRKDVAGMFSADPKRIPAARLLDQLSYEEASELAYYGAKVLHPLAIQPAMRKKMPVCVRSTFDDSSAGTRIHQTGSPFPTNGSRENTSGVRALTSKPSVTLIDIISLRMLGQSGFLADVFRIFQEHDISVDMVATSEVSVSLTLNRGNELSTEARAELERIARVEVHGRKAVMSIIGDTSRSSSILSLALSVLDERGIAVQMISHGASKTNIGLIIEDHEADAALKLLHFVFIEQFNEGTTINRRSGSDSFTVQRVAV